MDGVGFIYICLCFGRRQGWVHDGCKRFLMVLPISFLAYKCGIFHIHIISYSLSKSYWPTYDYNVEEDFSRLITILYDMILFTNQSRAESSSSVYPLLTQLQILSEVEAASLLLSKAESLDEVSLEHLVFYCWLHFGCHYFFASLFDISYVYPLLVLISLLQIISSSLSMIVRLCDRNIWMIY